MIGHEPIRILITGDPDNLKGRLPKDLTVGRRKLEWSVLRVLHFERIPVKKELLVRFESAPYDWAIFSSPRGVHYWSRQLKESQIDFPPSTKVACIGKQTATEAKEEGFSVHFFPSEPGTETFLEEFLPFVKDKTPTILLLTAKQARPTLENVLRQWRCEVTKIDLYDTLSNPEVAFHADKSLLGEASMLVLTSPSSVEAINQHYTISPKTKLVCLGTHTSDHLKKKGWPHAILPQGDLNRIGELL